MFSKALESSASDTVPPRQETLLKLLRLVENHADLCHMSLRLLVNNVTGFSLLPAIWPESARQAWNGPICVESRAAQYG